jgi:hypothetical protein
MLKKPYCTRPTQACRDTHFPSCVLASLKTSRYSGEYAWAFRSLRPWTGRSESRRAWGWVGENEGFLNIRNSTAVRKGRW